MEEEPEPGNVGTKSEGAEQSKQNYKNEEEKQEEAQIRELTQEVEVLSDCVWFTLRLAKHLKYSPDNKYIVQYSLTILNKYVVIKGLKESLLE